MLLTQQKEHDDKTAVKHALISQFARKTTNVPASPSIPPAVIQSSIRDALTFRVFA